MRKKVIKLYRHSVPLERTAKLFEEVSVLWMLITLTLSLISTFTFMVSCNNYNQSNYIAPPKENIEQDTVKPIVIASFKTTAYPSIFEAAFSNDTKVTQGDITYNFLKLDLGEIKVESGKLIACDPIVMHDASPFIQNFPIDQH